MAKQLTNQGHPRRRKQNLKQWQRREHAASHDIASMFSSLNMQQRVRKKRHRNEMEMPVMLDDSNADEQVSRSARKKRRQTSRDTTVNSDATRPETTSATNANTNMTVMVNNTSAADTQQAQSSVKHESNIDADDTRVQCSSNNELHKHACLDMFAHHTWIRESAGGDNVFKCVINNCHAGGTSLFKNRQQLYKHVHKDHTNHQDTSAYGGFLSVFKRAICRGCSTTGAKHRMIGGYHPSCIHIDDDLRDCKMDDDVTSAAKDLSAEVGMRILATYVPIVKALHPVHHVDFAKALLYPIKRIVKTNGNDDEAMLQLLATSKIGLQQFPRKGKRHKERNNNWRKQILRDLGRGVWRSHWAKLLDRVSRAKAKSKSKPKDMTDQQRLKSNIKRAISLAHGGSISKASNALVAEGLVELNAEKVVLLNSKYPKGQPVRKRSAPQVTQVKVNRDILDSVIWRLDNTGKGGADQLSNAMLKKAWRTADSTDFDKHYLRFMSIITSGKLKSPIGQLLNVRRGVALKKGDNDVRPIGIGIVHMNVVSKSVARIITKEAKQVIGKTQVGVAEKNGTELLVHSMSSALEFVKDNNDYAILSVDFQNAFNTVSRDKVLELIHLKLPSVYGLLQYIYGAPSQVIYSNEVIIKATAGVVQGDALSGIAFCLVLADALGDSPVTKSKDALGLQYYDDCYVIGRHAQLIDEMRHLQSKTVSHGLVLKPSKSICIGTKEWRNPFGIKTITSLNTSFLKVPVGDASHIDKTITERLAQTYKKLSILQNMNDSQVAMLILRQCLSMGKMVYYLRCLNPTLTWHWQNMFDAQLVDTVHGILGTTLGKRSSAIASMSPRAGGLGVRLISDRGLAAFIASAGACRTRMDALFEDFVGALEETHDVSGIDDCMARDVIQAIGQFNGMVRDCDRIYDAEWTQRELTARLDRKVWVSVYDSSNRRDQHLMVTHMRRSAMAWANAIPCPWKGTVMKPLQYRVCAKRALGLRIDADKAMHCVVCRRSSDSFGDHALRCMGNGDITTRHNKVVQSLSYMMHRAHISHSIEDRTNARSDMVGGMRRPGDVAASSFMNANVALIDVGIVESLRKPDTFNSGDDALEHVKEYATCVDEYEKHKRESFAKHKQTFDLRYGDSCTFTPAIFDTNGGWNDGAHSIIKELAMMIAKRQASDNARSIADILCGIRQRISVAIQVSVAQQIITRHVICTSDDV